MANPFARTSVAAGAPVAPNAGAAAPTWGSNAPTLNFSAVRSDVSDVMAGRVTLAMLDLIILALIGFYVATKTAQGGA